MFRCLRRRPEPGVRGRGQALVHVYPAATAGVVGIMQGVQKGPDLGRERPARLNTSQPVDFSPGPDPDENTQVER